MSVSAVRPSSLLTRITGLGDPRPFLVVEREGGELRYSHAILAGCRGDVAKHVQLLQRGLLPIDAVCVERGPESWERQRVADVNPSSPALKREAAAKAQGLPLPKMPR